MNVPTPMNETAQRTLRPFMVVSFLFCERPGNVRWFILLLSVRPEHAIQNVERVPRGRGSLNTPPTCVQRLTILRATAILGSTRA